ncbi:AraC family transcriptional regulator [Streptomyces sp. NPDC058464]|uniref:AraC family transcriptional regulator n=1 Tax=Streptomyces sp. NPDC058464 TaxID=3346511 RepID=UPI00365ABFE4
MTVSVPRPKVFTTDSAGPDRVGAWEAHNAAQLIALRCEAPHGTDFDAAEVNMELGGSHIARVSGTRHMVSRTENLIESDPVDALAVYATLRGEAVLEYAGRKRVLHPGEILVCDADRPLVRGFGHGLEELAVRVPKDVIRTVCGLDSLGEPLVMDARTDGYARALVRLVGSAVGGRMPVPPDEQALVELVCVLAIGDRAGQALRHRAAARAYIAEHLHDPSLSAVRVAAAVGVSERTLSRVFAVGGASVPQQILDRRLDVAYALLKARPGFTTAETSAHCGFRSFPYFSQTFQRRFGMTAGEVRRSAHGNHAADTRCTPLTGRDGDGF